MRKRLISPKGPALFTACAGALLATQTASAQFTSDKVSLHAFMDFNALGTGSEGNDCWGYTSPSGREYALMGVNNAMVVVEITTPGSPVVIGTVPHTSTSWGDIKTYQDHAYVVNDFGGGGMDVVDLSDVDNGNVTYVQSILWNGPGSISHNVAIDETSGYLYLCGANTNGGRLVVYDLANPANPVLAGTISSAVGDYIHDAQIVTYTSGPYAGMQVAFGASEGRGLDVYDVTDKNNMTRMSRTPYPNVAYAHQVWLSADRQYCYLNDELEGVNETVIFDVTNLSAPVIANTSNSGTPAGDHNQYVRDGFMYEADYRSGLRIMCNDDPINPVLVGWFDTFPGSDADGFEGAWSNYPFFPSGTVIVSDITRGLFILDPSEALTSGALTTSYPNGRPAFIAPTGGTTMRVDINASCGAESASGTAMLHYDAGAGFVSTPLSVVSGTEFDAVFPALACGTQVNYYISAESTGGDTFTDPTGAPASTYSTVVATGVTTQFEDDYEADLGWVATFAGATSGFWQRGNPVDDSNWAYDPATDGDGSGQCYLTQNEFGNTDVDGGIVTLTSPVLDMSTGDPGLSYEYYLNLTESGTADALILEISSNGDAGPWTEIAHHDVNQGLNWVHHDVFNSDLVDAGVTLGANMKVRFSAGDANPQSIVEAGVDGFKINALNCGPPADLDGNGSVGVTDLLILLGAWGPCDAPCPPSCLADIDGDCQVGVTDLLILLGAWTT